MRWKMVDAVETGLMLWQIIDLLETIQGEIGGSIWVLTRYHFETLQGKSEGIVVF